MLMMAVQVQQTPEDPEPDLKATAAGLKQKMLKGVGPACLAEHWQHIGRHALLDMVTAV